VKVFLVRDGKDTEVSLAVAPTRARAPREV